jgi:hypothetical protein
MKSLSEIREFATKGIEKCKDADLPWHIGHINEANPNRMDVDTASGRNVMDDNFGEYGFFACHVSTAFPEACRLLLELCDALESKNFVVGKDFKFRADLTPGKITFSDDRTSALEAKLEKAKKALRDMACPQRRREEFKETFFRCMECDRPEDAYEALKELEEA